jgi:hypothetical protein
MAINIVKVVDDVAYATGTAQYIVLPASHHADSGRSVLIKKVSGTGTLDVHPIEFSVDGVTYTSVFSRNGEANPTLISEATNQTAYAFDINVNFPYARLKIDVNTDTVNLTVVQSMITG